jgi:tetratricopeptide (TPR) repeat protein
MGSPTVLLAAVLSALVGCGPGPQYRADTPGQPSLNAANQAYRVGDYDRAYREAMTLVGTPAGGNGEAAYLAGLAARQQGRLPEAQRLLQQAARRAAGGVAGDAKAELGLVLSQRGRYARAANHLEQAGEQLSGRSRARALLHAGIARQKLGQWSRARSNLRQAQAAATAAPKLTDRIRRQLKVTGYTIQVGAFSKPDNARQAADRWRDRARRQGLSSPRLVRPGQGSGSSLIRVHVGRFDQFDAAVRAQRRLSRSDAFIVPLAEE